MYPWEESEINPQQAEIHTIIYSNYNYNLFFMETLSIISHFIKNQERDFPLHNESYLPTLTMREAADSSALSCTRVDVI